MDKKKYIKKHLEMYMDHKMGSGWWGDFKNWAKEKYGEAKERIKKSHIVSDTIHGVSAALTKTKLAAAAPLVYELGNVVEEHGWGKGSAAPFALGKRRIRRPAALAPVAMGRKRGGARTLVEKGIIPT